MSKLILPTYENDYMKELYHVIIKDRKDSRQYFKKKYSAMEYIAFDSHTGSWANHFS